MGGAMGVFAKMWLPVGAFPMVLAREGSGESTISKGADNQDVKRMDEPLSVAPMMDWTHGHWRAYFRGITRKTVLYSEMIVDATILHQVTPFETEHWPPIVL